ncbi:iron complex outermembrane recepter protein [Roseovarius azorensis]|uniref:Iron complex outermembrane recepter protein n=1 Tax=Roseovarius azorensis TaxID=1287727 RepID=A0A1H7M240_9RHOB|nr:TonB-dependent receptor [Roseovarius azorensis]SEL04667.1 iron complex outermembrane recepter protein [Roseovarius azorensis]
MELQRPLAVCLAALTAFPAIAQTTNEDETVELGTLVLESATRTETPVDETTRSVSVIDRETVQEQRRVDNTIGDILSKQVPGFSQSTEANSDFGQTLRGRTFLTLIDGVPQSTPLRDGRRSLNSIGAEAIEQIEIIRGGTAMYGFGATGGLVNIITKRPEDGAFNLEVGTGLSFSTQHVDDSLTWETSLNVSGRTGKLDYVFSGSFLQRGGRFDADGDRIPADPVGAQGGIADSDTSNLMLKLGYQLTEDQRLEVSTLYYNMEQDSNFAGISFAGDPDTDTKTPAVRGNFNPVNPGTENRNISLKYSNEDLLGSSVDLQFYHADIDIVYSKFPGFSQTRIGSEKLGARLTVDTPVTLGASEFNVIWGFDYLHDETRQTATDGPNTSPFLEQDAYAGFVQVNAPIGDIGKISGGMRHEIIDVDVSDFNRADGSFVPGGTLEFEETLFNISGTLYLTDRTDIYAGFSQGFTVADIGRSITDNTFATVSQASSEAQKTDNYEIGLRTKQNRWDGTIAMFFNESDNGATFDQNLNIVKQPEQIWGVEATLDVYATDTLTLGGTFTWMAGEVDLDGDGSFEEDLPSTRIAPAKITAYADYAPNDKWRARLQALYSADRNVNSTQFGGTSDIDDYLVFDLYGEIYDIAGGTVELGVDNIFNNEYTPVINQAYDSSFAYARAPGRTVSIGYTRRF